MNTPAALLEKIEARRKRGCVRLSRIGGVAIEVHVGAPVAAVLVALFFQSALVGTPGWSVAATWLVSAAVAVVYLLSALAHELGHALVARRFGLTVRRVALYAYGGVTDMAAETPPPKHALWVALAGLCVSFGLAALCGGLWLVAGAPLVAPMDAGGGAAVTALVAAALNGGIGLFNSLPLFPLDGGRIVRAARARR